jgi:putative phosphoesterase
MILVFGDTHGNQKALEGIAGIITIEKPDLFVHAGDNYRDFLWLKKQAKIRGVGVRGNCDFGFLPGARDEFLFDYKNKKILLAHGHRHGVKTTYQTILDTAKEQKADAVIFGHTHIQYAQKHQGIWMVNPGSVCLPRGGSGSGYAKISLVGQELKAELIQIQF